MLGVYVSVPIACFRKGLAREFLETESIPPPATCYGFLLSLVGEMNRRRHVGCRVTPTMLGDPPTSVVLRTVWRIKGSNSWRDKEGRWHMVPDSKQKQFRKWLHVAVSRIVEGCSESETISRLENLSWGELLFKWLSGETSIPEVPVHLTEQLEKLVTAWSASKSEFVPLLGSGENARPDYQQLLTGIELVLWIDSSGESPEQEMTLEQRVTSALNDPSSVTRFGGLSLGESTHLVDEVSLLDRMESRLGTRSGRHFLLADRGSMTLPVWVDHVGSAGTRYATGNLVVRPALTCPSIDAMPVIHPEYAS